MTSQSINPQFIQSIHNGLKYWQKKTSEIESNQVQWLNRQRRNLFQAVSFGIQTEETWEATVTVLLQSFDFVEWGGYWQAWIPILEQALASAPDTTSAINGRLHNRLGQLYRMSQQHASATAQHEKALHIAVALADKDLEVTGLVALCEVHLDLKKSDKAEAYGKRALAIIQDTQENGRLAAFLYKNLGAAAYLAGNWELAAERQKQAIRLWRSQNNLVYTARSLNDLGNTYIGAQDFPAAQLAFEEAGAILQETINESDKAMIYLNLGVLHYRQKKWLAAEESFLQINATALRERQEMSMLGLLHNNLGNVYLETSRWEKAAKNLELAANLFRKTKDYLNLANCLGTLARVYAAIDEKNEAAFCYKEAIDLLQTFPDNRWAQDILADFSEEYQALLIEQPK